MTTPTVALASRGQHTWSPPAEVSVDFELTSHVELTSRPDSVRPFTMLATRLHLHWWWDGGKWRSGWSIFGRRWRKATNDWSPHEQAFMSEYNIDMPDWVRPLIEANAPTMTPVVPEGGQS